MVVIAIALTYERVTKLIFTECYAFDNQSVTSVLSPN